jgi:hypothetical protein
MVNIDQFKGLQRLFLTPAANPVKLSATPNP